MKITETAAISILKGLEQAVTNTPTPGTAAVYWAEKFSRDECAAVPATVISGRPWDQRFSRENMAWAQKYPDRLTGLGYPDAIHPARMNQICTSFRRYFREV